MFTFHVRRLVSATAVALALLSSFAAPALAQTPTWTGVVADEARTAEPPTNGNVYLRQNALSGDGRFLAFESDRALVPGDSNGMSDVFLRDRSTGTLTRVSVSSSGEEANQPSFLASISRDGRHILFISCATNLVVPEIEMSCAEVYVHDRVLATTTRVSLKTSGEPFTHPQTIGTPQISADGRYVLFGASDEPLPGFHSLWLRDRDADADGIFDEPGSSTTTAVRNEQWVGTERLTWLGTTAMSADARWIAYEAATYNAASTFLGWRLFLYDRNTGTTVRVDQPPINDYGFSRAASFSDTGELVYSTTVNYLVPEDTGNFEDIFVVNLLTLTHTQIPHATQSAFYPAITADGRYVVYSAGLYTADTYVFDRVAETSYTISLQPDGTPDQASSIASISADGSAIAFTGTPAMLAAGGTNEYGVFVATAVDVTPTEIAASSEFGTYTFTVSVPADIAWTLTFDVTSGIDVVTPSSGTGPATVDVSLFENFTGDERVHVIGLGSKKVTLTQEAGVAVASPNEGPASGGTTITITGSNFTQASTVTIGGTPATDVTWVSDTTLTAVTPAYAPAGWKDIVVSSPAGGPPQEYQAAFHYFDDTAPEITPVITGTLGTNDWYVSDVTVAWSVTDPESSINYQSCDELSLTSDSSFEFVTCSAESAGGYNNVDLYIKRDATAPSIEITSPVAQTYLGGDNVPLTFSCDDQMSGVATCTADQSGALDTSTPGTFTFTVTAVDEAGNSSTSSVEYTVERRTPVITWTDPSPVTYPAALSASELNAAADVPGSFSYSPALGTVLDAGYHELTATFTPTNQAGYTTAEATVAIIVDVGNATISWPEPATITYGTPLSAVQLNATHDANSGTIEYFPPAGTVLDAGTQVLYAQFNPDDGNYNYAYAENTITVLKATPSLSWNSPTAMVYGTALDTTQLNATANAAGTFQYSPAAGTVLTAGTHTLNVTFTPVDAQNYNGAATSVTIVVGKATPTVTWSDPAGIGYGTALSSTQLNATANVPGNFAYSPTAGTVLSAGTQTLSVTFAPADAANYNGASANVSLTVGKATPVVTWSDPAGIVYGTALSGTQLNASANVAGTFAYSPAADTILTAGTQTLGVTFTPSDAANYNTATGSATIAVDRATPVVSWSNPAGITYGTALSGTQLNATANVAGSFAYSPAAGTVLGAGTQSLSVTFTPSDTANYNNANGSQSIAVAAKALTVTTNNASKVYGQALPVFSISGSGFVNGDTIASLSGTPSYSTSATATSAPGNYSVTPSDVSSPNYSIAFVAGTLTISKADTTVTLTTSPSPSSPNQNVTMTATVAAAAPGEGTPTGTVEFRDNGTLLGTGTLANGVATFTMKLKKGSHPLTATYVASTNYNGSVGSKTHQVN